MHRKTLCDPIFANYSFLRSNDRIEHAPGLPAIIRFDQGSFALGIEYARPAEYPCSTRSKS